MRLALDEFLRRFFLHVLPKGFVRIRHFGFFAHRRRALLLPLCFSLPGKATDSQTDADSTPTDPPGPLWTCLECGGAMAIVERFTATEARLLLSPNRFTGNGHDLVFDISNLDRFAAPAVDDCPTAGQADCWE